MSPTHSDVVRKLIHHTALFFNSTATLATKHKLEACFYSRMRTSQEICQVPNPRQAACCVSSDRTHCSFLWCEEKQSAVCDSSTGAGFVSLDAGLRMEGMPALNLWDTVIKVLHPTVNRNSVQIAKPQQRPKTPNPIGSIDYIPPKSQLLSQQTTKDDARR